MKTILTYALLALSMALGACNEQPSPFDTALTIMVDETDTLPVYPSVTTLLTPFKLKEQPWQSLEITALGIEDKDITTAETITLPKENPITGNPIIRQARLARFAALLQGRLAAIDSVRSRPRSIVFRAVAQQAALLANRTAAHRYLLVYSDLMEHSNVNFYDPNTRSLLQTNPAIIEKQMEAEQQLPDLPGVQMWFVYKPKTYRENNLYMRIARFYERVYTAHHATVHIATTFELP